MTYLAALVALCVAVCAVTAAFHGLRQLALAGLARLHDHAEAAR